MNHEGVRLPDSVSQLSALRELDLNGWADTKPPSGLVACQQLSRLKINRAASSPVLARLQSLRSLSVSPDSDPASVPYWTQLTALTELNLVCGDYKAIHPGLGSMTSLRTLELMVTGEEGLGDEDFPPAGPYLSRQESLALSPCAAVPASLAAATQLRELDLRVDDQMELSSDDQAALTALPALETLFLAQPDNLDQAVWDERVLQLRTGFLTQDRLLSVLGNTRFAYP